MLNYVCSGFMRGSVFLDGVQLVLLAVLPASLDDFYEQS